MIWLFKTPFGKKVDLARTPYFPKEIMMKQCREMRDEMLNYAVNNIEYWKQFKGVVWEDIPITDKNFMRGNMDFISPDFLNSDFASYRTSGTTGEPFRYIRTQLMKEVNIACMKRGWSWGGWFQADKVFTFAGAGLGKYGGHHFDCTRLNDELVKEYHTQLTLRSGRGAKEGIYRGLPSALFSFAKKCDDLGLKIPKKKLVITTSEVLYPHQRKLFENTYGKSFDTYGMNDSGTYSMEREKCKNFNDGFHYGHLAFDKSYIEITDDEGNVLPEGEVGNITGTCLFNSSMPFIRYRMGDKGAIIYDHDCPCGCNLPILTKLQGRETDYIVVGNNIVNGTALVNSFNPLNIREMQFYQPDKKHLIIKVIPEGTIWMKQIRNHAKKIIGEGIDVEIKLVERIDRTKQGKLKYCISEVKL